MEAEEGAWAEERERTYQVGSRRKSKTARKGTNKASWFPREERNRQKGNKQGEVGPPRIYTNQQKGIKEIIGNTFPQISWYVPNELTEIYVYIYIKMLS